MNQQHIQNALLQEHCIVYWDNHHIYKLNDNLDSLAQKVHNKIHKRLMEQKYEQSQQVFSNYAMRNFEAEETSKTIFIKDLNEICTYVKKNCKNKKPKKHSILCFKSKFA